MRPLAMTAALVAAAVLGACGDDEGDRSKRDPARFSADVDNRYWPLEPGTRWIYREVDEEGRELRVIVTATTETAKLANGVTARVVRDTVLDGRELVEDTFDWYAQDDEGNVWYMGERTAEYEDGRLVTRAGSWEAGVDGARPGTLMPATPRDDMRYRQEYYAGEAEDSGEILAVDEQVQVPAGHFDEAVLTKDTNALEPRVLEYKLYAPGVGMALALGVSGGGGREELLRMERVDPSVARAAGTAPLGEPYPR